MTMSSVQLSIEALGAGRWRVRATRTLGDISASAALVVTDATPPDAAHFRHAGALGAAAWLRIAQQLIAHNRADDAYTCAQSGIAELGLDYAHHEVLDDTSQKLHAARYLVQTGKAADGAALAARMLAERITHYQRRYGIHLEE